MNQRKKLKIHLHCVSPLHIADASSGASHVDSKGSIFNGKVPGTLPVSRIERKPILVPAAICEEEEDKVLHFPYIKSNNIVGRLRRHAHDVISEEYIERGEQMPGTVYRGLSCGSSSGTPSSRTAKLSEVQRARKNVYLGLFGGSDFMTSSGFVLRDFDLKHQHLVSSGVLPAEIEGATTVAPFRLTYPISLVKRDRMLELTDFNIEKVVEGGNKTIEEWRDLVAGSVKDKADAENDGGDKKARREMLKNLVAYEAALAGLGYYSEVTMQPGTSDAHVGMLLECFSRLAQNNGLGGKTSKGFGRFNLTVKEGDRHLLQVVDGNIVKSDQDDYAEALADALEDLDVSEMNSYYQ
jgi:CRISPR type IV-associated protein Csf2